eukprot:m51a1_g11919 hypothetical protein (327) ;mRNA; f:665194-666174
MEVRPDSLRIRAYGKDVPLDAALAPLAPRPRLLEAVRALVADGTLSANGFAVPGPRAAAAARDAGASVTELGDALCCIASAALAHPPVSNFRVGAVARCATTGDLVLGANVEYAGAPFSVTVHAEQAAVSRAMARDPTGVAELAVDVIPCGHCRQLLVEFDQARDLELRLRGAPEPLRALIPKNFGPRDLNLDPRDLISGRRRRLRLADDVPQQLERLARAAAEAAERAFAPYSGCLAGVALELPGERVVAGTCIESAAFNPTMSPVNAAIVQVAGSGYALSEVRAAVIVEACASSITSHVEETALVLRCACPGAALTSFKAVACD